MPSGLAIEAINVVGATVAADASTSGSVVLLLDRIAVGGSATVTYDVRVTSALAAIGTTLQNDPEITWTSLPDGVPAGATSERDGDLGNAAEDDYNDAASESVTIIHPLVEVTQETVSTTLAASGTVGNFDITYDIVVTSTGNDPLTQVNLQENFRSLFGNGFVGVVAPPIVIASSASDPPEISPTYDGTFANSTIFDNSFGNANRLAGGESVTVRLTVEVDPDAPGAVTNNGDFVSQAGVSAIGEASGISAVDLSDNPADLSDVESDIVADAEPDDPNTHRFPILSLTKSIVGSPVPSASGVSGNFDVTYRLVIENDGSTAIERLALEEDLQSHFGTAFVSLVGTPTMASTATDPPSLNTGFTGMSSGAQIFDTSVSRLDVNQTVTVTLVVEVNADATGGNRDSTSGGLDNQATVTGYDPNDPTVPVRDSSDDPADATDSDLNADGDPDDPTRLLLREIVVVKETIGGPVPAASGTEGNHDVTFEITLTNQGNEPLETLSLLQDFQADYGGAFVGLVGSPVIVAGSSATDPPEINGAYTGRPGGNELFDQSFISTDRLQAGERVTVRLTVELDPDAPGGIISGGDFVSQSLGRGQGTVTSLSVQDLSDDPGDPTESNPDADLDPDDPNRIRIPLISVTKQVVGTPVPSASGTQGNFDVTYQLRIENTGSTPLEHLVLTEDFGSHLGGAMIGIISPPTIIGGNAADMPGINSGFTGTAVATGIFDAGNSSRLETAQFVVVQVTVEIDPDALSRQTDSVSFDGSGDFETQAVVTGIDPGTSNTVSDRSDDPTDTTNVDGDPSNPLDTSDDDNDPDDPTAIWLPSITLTKTQVGDLTPAVSGVSGNFDVVYDLRLTNNGNEPLQTLSLIEDLQSQFGSAFVRVVPQSGFPATVVASSATDVPEINGGYTGDAAGSTELFSNTGANTNLLATGQSVTVRLVIEFDADAPGGNRVAGNYVTSADVFGTGRDSTVRVTDRSDDPLVVNGIDVYSDNDPDDPNFVRVPDITLTKTVLGTPAPAASGIVGNYDVVYEFVVQNTGTTPLENLSVVDDWAGQFGGAFVRIVPGTLSVTDIDTGSPPGANVSYTGSTGQNLLDGTGSFDSGQSFVVHVTVEVDPNAPGAIRQTGRLVNQAVAGANDPVAPLVPVTDLSDDPTDATNADGDPADPSDDDNNPDDPTALGFTDIGLSKRILSSSVSTTTPGAMTLVYELVVRNVGSSDLTNLTLTDDLFAGLGNAFVGMVASPVISGSTAATDPILASGFDGNLAAVGSASIFDGSSGWLRPTEEITIVFAVDVHPEFLSTTSNNQAVAGGRDGVELVSDLSDTGTDPEHTNPGPQNDSGGEDDATLVPGIAITKDHLDPVRDAVNPAHWNIPVSIRVVNTGSLRLTGLELMEDIASQFGQGFVSAGTPVLIPVNVTSGDMPIINPSWELSTSSNMLQSGSLNPGDEFIIEFVVTVDPDQSGPAVALNNQSTISGYDSTRPAITVHDASDSGSALDTNAGQPGDTGSVDDATPLEIAEIGVAKRVTDVQMIGLTSLVTVQIVVENTGTTFLRDLSLTDDLATEFSANFDSIVTAPQIVSSSATADPNLNGAYSGDTSTDILDGSSGVLAPGERFVVELVVRVAATPGQASVVLTNQAAATATATDAIGNLTRDQNGSLLSRVMDLSDSGIHPGTTNASAPGDTGGSDDPTPTPITFFTFDQLNNFSDPFDVVRRDSELTGSGNRLLSFEIPSLAPDPMFSGAARPGTKIVARVYDSDGFQIASESVFADVGGNWMMQIHEMERQDYVRVEFEEVSGNLNAFAPGGDTYGYLGADQEDNLYTALEPWAAYEHQYDYNAVYRGSARAALARAHQQASRPIGFGL